ncbi:MAG: divergent PAP2 family protein [Eubacterium sp.]|nr:divergent PAP2 family protein [Eubacterium sp.]
MNYFNQIVTNKILMSGVVGWAAAQVLKTLIFLIVNKKLQLERLFGDGGMPSGHSATVSAVALSAGLECGFASPIFAVAMIMAIVVMHDAAGVRLETGKQAKVLNEMMELMEKLSGSELSYEDKLKEFVGHTPFQVGIGCLLGILVAALMHL